jgi:hypothetical protein
VAEPFKKEVDRLLGPQVIVCFDYQVLEFRNVAVDVWVSEFEFIELVSGAQLGRGVYDF